jgi:hypothetical protein
MSDAANPSIKLPSKPSKPNKACHVANRNTLERTEVAVTIANPIPGVTSQQRKAIHTIIRTNESWSQSSFAQ